MTTTTATDDINSPAAAVVETEVRNINTRLDDMRANTNASFEEASANTNARFEETNANIRQLSARIDASSPLPGHHRLRLRHHPHPLGPSSNHRHRLT